MKTTPTTYALPVIIILALISSSWNLLNQSHRTEKLNAQTNFDGHFKLFPITGQGFNNVELFMKGDGPFSEPTLQTTASTADVLIQKIPGDEQHILMMAFYFKELFKESYITVTNGDEKITFRDDGTGYDKKANDGLYTAKVATDVNQLRKMALVINSYAQKNTKKNVQVRWSANYSLRRRCS